MGWVRRRRLEREKEEREREHSPMDTGSTTMSNEGSSPSDPSLPPFTQPAFFSQTMSDQMPASTSETMAEPALPPIAESKVSTPRSSQLNPPLNAHDVRAITIPGKGHASPAFGEEKGSKHSAVPAMAISGSGASRGKAEVEDEESEDEEAGEDDNEDDDDDDEEEDEEEEALAEEARFVFYFFLATFSRVDDLSSSVRLTDKLLEALGSKFSLVIKATLTERSRYVEGRFAPGLQLASIFLSLTSCLFVWL